MRIIQMDTGQALFLCFTMVTLFYVADCQNNSPDLTIPAGSLATIAEDAATGTSVYKCTATDADDPNTDDGTLMYEISPPVAGLFLDASNCIFYVVPGLDYDANTVVSGTVTVTDKGGLKDVAAFAFDLADANDNTPSCTSLVIVGTLSEDATVGDKIATFDCTDADQANTVNSQVEFQVFPPSNAIDVNSTTGEATLKRLLDFENDGSSITATVRVFDKGSTQLTVTGTVVLDITDVDDNIPVFDLVAFLDTEPEDIAVGTTLIRVNATDIDEPGTDSSKVTFGLSEPCSPDVILLDQLTGDLVLKSSLDYETATAVTCNLTAFSSDRSSATSAATFTLTVEDVNDAAPVFNQTFYTVTVPENEVAGTLAIQVAATDSDSGVNGQIVYGMTDSSSTFEIDNSTGEVKVKTPPDYEASSSYLFSVTASDEGTPSLTASVYLQILIGRVNEFTPSFQDSPSIADTPENTVPGTSIHQVNITDADGGVDGTITYRILTADVPFIVDTAGAIRVSSDLDYETTTSYQFVVEAKDSSDSTIKSSTATYTVTITDVDDVALTCDPVSTLALTGGAASTVGFVQATLVCTDPDTSTGTLTYSIDGGNDDNAWTINAGGQVSLQSAPTQSRYDLSISVTDGGNSTTVNFTAFTESTLALNTPWAPVTVAEGGSGTTLLNASACCVFGQVSYTILSGNDNNAVSMVSSTGELKHLLSYDRETTSSYQYVVQALSASGQTATATFTVSVGDMNDNSPLFAQNVYQISVIETLAVSAPIQTYTATDADEGVNANLTYSIVSGNGAGKFSMDSVTGELTLAGALDYETTQSYQLVLHAVDAGSTPRTGSTTVVISVANADDASPTIIPAPGSYSLSLSEDEALGKSVFDIDASDADSGSSFTFAIESGNADSDFGIDTDTGYVFLAKFLDRERTDSYTLILTAVDSVFSSTATATLDVTVTDVNDNDPVFTPSVFEFSVDHNAGVGVSVGDITVDDADIGDNAVLNHSIVSGNTGNAFTLDDLQVTTAAIMDYTTISRYRLTVQSIDNGSPARTATTVVIVNVLPDADQPDFGTTTSATVSLNEDIDVGYQVYDLDATHLGAVESDGSTLYSITSGDPSSKFGVRQNNGQVYLASTLDYETTQSYTLVIQAKNSVTTANTADFTLTINVVNINEHNPIFKEISTVGQNSFSFSVDELSSAGTVVGSVSATDDDTGAPGTVTHTLSGSSDFAIDATTGEITVTGNLDYTATNLYNLVVTATDGGSTARSESVSVVIRVDDVNNNSPVFTSASTAQVLDSAPTGSEFFHLHATDVDTGAPGTIEYSIVTDPSVGKLTVDPNTGVMSVAGQLDAAVASSYVLTVKAADQGDPSRETTSTLTVTVISTIPNNHDPEFATSPVSATVSREAAVGTTVVAISATDADSGESGDVIHRIVSGNSDGFFLIDRTSGAVSTAASVLTAENTYSLVVEARDLGVPYRSTNVTVNIAVNPLKTSFTTPDYVFTVDESVSTGHLVGEILQDTERTASSYVIDAGNFDTSFAIALDGATKRGRLTTLKALDYEAFPVYSLLISVETDIGSYTKVVEVRLNDVNDNPPSFASNTLTLTLAEHMPVGYTAATISLTDADHDSGNRDNVLSLSDPGPDLFSIDQSGHLTIATSPDFETVGSQLVFDVVAKDQQPPQGSATVTVTVNILDVVEDDERPHSAVTTNAMIGLGVHFPASDGDIIHVLTPGDFGIVETSTAVVEYQTFARDYPFSLSTTGELTVRDAASLRYPGKYFHWALCRSTDVGVTTSRVSLLRLDTYDRNTHMAVFEFSEAMETVRSGLETFTFRAQNFLSANQRLGISNLLDTSTNAGARRRLLATQTAAYTYVLDTSTGDLTNIDQDREFLTVEQILEIFQKSADGTPRTGISSSQMSISAVEPFRDSTGDNDFATSTAGIAVWALVGFFLLLLIIGVVVLLVWRRKTRGSSAWEHSRPRKVGKNKSSKPVILLEEAQDTPRPSSAPRGTGLLRHRPGQPGGVFRSYSRLPNPDTKADTGKPTGLGNIDTLKPSNNNIHKFSTNKGPGPGTIDTPKASNDNNRKISTNKGVHSGTLDVAKPTIENVRKISSNKGYDAAKPSNDNMSKPGNVKPTATENSDTAAKSGNETLSVPGTGENVVRKISSNTKPNISILRKE